MIKILAADIGGTHSRFGFFEAPTGEKPVLRERMWLSSKGADSFEELMETLRDSGFAHGQWDWDIAVFAAPGAVIDNAYCNLTNVAWDIDIHGGLERFGARRAILINDFEAQAYGCRTEAVDESLVVHQGVRRHEDNVAVIGAGTGLGHCALTRSRRGTWIAVRSEAGHTEFPFRGEAEFEYMRFVLDRTGSDYCYGDQIVTGLGLELLHEFHTGRKLSASQVAAEMTEGSDTANWYSRFYGRAARNYCLSVMGLGGVYICGGVAAKNHHLVMGGEFMSEFLLSPTYGELMPEVRVRLVVNEDHGLFGAGYCGSLALTRHDM